MRNRRAHRACLLALSLCCALSGDVVFGPEPGSALTRRWSEALELEVDSLSETLGGNPVSVPFNEITFAARRTLVATDVLESCADGRATKLLRTHEASSLQLALELDGAPLGHLEGASVCDESEVHFSYDAEHGRYEREREQGTLDDEHLQRLEPDLDLLELLPPGEQAVDARWTLAPEALRRFFCAAGDLDFRPSAVVAEQAGVPDELLVAGALGSLDELFAADNELEGKLEGVRAADEEDENGATLARLEFELDVEAKAALGERFRALLDGASESTHDFSVAGEVEGQLVLLWDVAGRHLRSARFEGDVTLRGHLVFPMVVFSDQEALEFVGDYELSGKAVVALTVE